VVGDIDRGGVLAAMFGTLAVLEPADQALIAGFVVNKFRGDPALLAPGLTSLARMTGRQVYGVLPWRSDLWLDVEDSLALDARGRPGPAAAGPDDLRVAVVRLPRISNLTDTDPLAAEPGVSVGWVDTPSDLVDADLVILPGSKATVADLAWLHERGLAAAVSARAAAGRPVLGICGGYQMLARAIHDDVESRTGEVTGLGLLPCTVRFGPDKVVRRVGAAADGHPVAGYEIHHGRVTPDPGSTDFPGGTRAGAVWGTTWHGLLESDGFRRAFLTEVAAMTGRAYRPGAPVSFAAVRETRLDALADLVADHLDTEALDALLAKGVPVGLPTLSVALRDQ
jgi:adenosylcobyric acid synthase